MEAYDRKIRDMQQYLSFLEEKIQHIKGLKAKCSYPDPDREKKLNMFKHMYKILTNRDPKKKLTISTLEKFEKTIRKIQECDFMESRRARKENAKDINPFHNPDPYRSSSSCSTASGGSSSHYSRPKKVNEDTPASPSPPDSPPPYNSAGSSAPIIIPTVREPSPPPPPNITRPRVYDPSPPRSSASSSTSSGTRARYLFTRSPTPPPVIPKIVPITRVDVREIGPLEWDTDEEEDKVPDKRPEIVIPKLDVVSAAAKQISEKLSLGRKDEVKHLHHHHHHHHQRDYDQKRDYESKRDNEPRHHPSDNIPTVQVQALGGSRRLSTVIEKTNLLNNADFNRLLSSSQRPHQSPSPHVGLPTEALRSPEPPEVIHVRPPLSSLPMPPTHFSPPAAKRDVAPKTPSLLLNAPSTSSRLPIAIDDIAEFLDDKERNILDKRPDKSRPTVRIPGSSPPVLMSPRSETNISPLTDPRIPQTDPRTRPNVDPRSAHPSVPRYADNYERHKRMTSQEGGMPPADYNRQQHQQQPRPGQYGEVPQMVPPPAPHMHAGPTPVPPVAGPYAAMVPGPQMPPHNQMNYNYQMATEGYHQPQQQQPQPPPQWNGPPHMAAPPMAQGYGPNMQQQQQQTGWQFPQPEAHAPPMMNGDVRMQQGFPNQQMGRPNPPHVQPMMANSGYTTNKYPSYADSRGGYDQQHQQQQTPQNEYQRPRPAWAGGGISSDRGYGGRPNPSFTRPTGGPPSWNKDSSRPPNRDPRAAENRDPRTLSRPPMHQTQQPSSSSHEQNRSNSPAMPKQPPPGKEMHPNKLAKQAAAEKEAAAKKKAEVQKPDVHKSKDKDRDKDKFKHKEKSRDKDRPTDKSKPKPSMKSPLTDLYGTIDAKKSVQGSGLNKFKIPKKRPSIDTQPEPSPPIVEEESWDAPEMSTSSASYQPNRPCSPSTSKKSDKSKNDKPKEKQKSSEKEKEKEKEKMKEKEKEKDKEKEKETEDEELDKRDILKTLASVSNLTQENLSLIVEQLFKKLSKKKKKTVIYSSDDEEENEESSDEERHASKKKSEKKKKKKKPIIESSSEESSESDTPLAESSKEYKSKKAAESKKTSAKDKTDEEEKRDKIEKKKHLLKEVAVNLGQKKNLKSTIRIKSIEEIAPAKEPEQQAKPSTSTTATTEPDATPSEPVAETVEASVAPKPKPKRCRELDALQEDLKSSWICDGAMKATGSRTASQKKPQDQSDATEEETAKTTKGRKPGPKSKPGPKPKKAISETSLLASDESEEDVAKTKKSNKLRAKAPPPLFDESSNDSFTLDASAVEPSSDISLHPESGSGKKGKKSKKAPIGDGAAESSSDESFVSNSSSLLLEGSSRPRDNNEEVLEECMKVLATNPKYTAAVKKRQGKKKKNSWQMGIVSKKKKKKTTAANKADDTDTTTEKDNDSTISSEKNLSRTQSLDRLEEDETSTSTPQEDPELTSRIDSEALIGYTMSGNEKYSCLLCPFYGKAIVHHYKTHHAKKEVLISRYSTSDATLAIEEAKKLDFEHNESPPVDKEVACYTCRFCNYMTKGLDKFARDSFYEHCTSHTGEYRFTCQHCGFESASKGSLRTHYYKECRKNSNSKNLTEAMHEEPMPTEDRIYGYLCSKCNFVQLRKVNAEKHVRLWHSKPGQGDVKIIKIDMSCNIKREDIPVSVKTEDELVTQKVEPKDEKDEKDPIDTSTVDVNDTKENIAADANQTVDEPDMDITFETSEYKPEKIEKSNNLSAFVCPEELENKDNEIINDRKKKMEEIAQHIRKFDKERVSITDKLSAKMDTSLPIDEAEMSVTENMEVDANEPIAKDPLQISEAPVQNEKTTDVPDIPEIKKDPDESETTEKDKSSAKIKDPLALVDTAKSAESEEEGSDHEATSGPVRYDTDSSGEQSEHDEQQSLADVSSILQGTAEVASPSQGLMFTTIQRLRAQLQSKPPDTLQLPEGEPETIVSDTPDPGTVKIKKEKMSPAKANKNAAAVEASLLSPSKIKKEPKKEPESPMKVDEEPKPAQEANAEATQSPKPASFIRIRRISGDKLSKGGDQNESEDKSSEDKAKEDSGFLKIANVVSLAPNEADSQIVSTIRKVVETSPVKSLSILKKPTNYVQLKQQGHRVITSTGETVKLIPISLSPSARGKKPENILSIGGQQAVTIKIDPKSVAMPLVSTAGTASTSLVNSNNQPIKLLTINSPEVSVAIKLKSAHVYEKMLKEDKLIHQYKCMGRDCYFSTSSEVAFHKHLRLHEDDNKTFDVTRDYFKCAYCYIDCTSYEELMQHLRNMHIFCRFCCKYCFYRAFASSYVEIHQKTYHPMKKVQILVVGEELVQRPPAPKRMERKQIIKPYVCIHNCNKYFFIPEAFVLHLNMHHKNITNGFKCHHCSALSPDVESLIEHYKLHNYFKFHCMFCAHGSATIKDLHVHLSTAHYNQPPTILERTLPREISKNMSAIDQLRIRDVDQIYRQRKSIDDDLGKMPIPALPILPKMTNTPLTILPNSPVMTAKIMTPNESFMPLTSLDNGPGVSNIRILDARSLSTAPSVLSIGKNMKITVTDAPTLPNKIDENSEYVTSNLYDHKDLLSGMKTKIEQKPIVNSSTDHDSDCEIIEECRPISSAQSSPFVKKEEEKKEEPSDSASEVDGMSSNLSTSNLSLNSMASEQLATLESPKAGAFLTLDDIKGTGFVGRDLFICGVENCQQRFETAETLRAHMQQCNPAGDDEQVGDSALYCDHCGPLSKRFMKPSFYIDHLKTHGIKRFSCAVCRARFAVQSQAQSHLRQKHKYTVVKIVPADPANPSADGLFVIHPIATKGKKPSKAEKEQLKSQDTLEKTTYAPNEISSLPMQAIYNRAVQCAICPYSNKVRSNMIRHLQAHLKDESVPESSPVNPVPCLDKKERMFDKMVNLASSSHENGRMGGGGSNSASSTALKEPVKSEDEEFLPKFVPENQRYVCGVPECNYLTVEEAMLRHHLKALHSDEVYFRCPHCPASTTTPSSNQQQDQQQQQQIHNNIALDKMGVHLKMHDSRLYKCSHCIYHHYQRHVVDRHLTDKHPDKRPFAKVIREPQSEEQAQQNAQIPSFSSANTTSSQESEETTDPDGNTWKCNLCDFKCVLKGAVQQHATSAHDEKCQFKCNGCQFKSISKATLDQHMTTKHAHEPHVDFTTVYQRIKGLKKPESEIVTPQDEPFDTTPLWRRDMPRIRHIRGILLEEEDELGPKATKRKSTKSTEDCKSPDAKRARVINDDTERFPQLPDGGYGSHGRPVGECYSCPLCNTFKSKYKQDFRDHMFRDLKYLRWACTCCDYRCVTRGALVKHLTSKHPHESTDVAPGSPNESIEEWVAQVVKTQTDILKSSKEASMGEDEEMGEESEEDDLVIDTKDDDDADNDNSDDEKVTGELLPMPLTCKHCQGVFTKWRGFKRHVQCKHLKRLAFLCPYCDFSSNKEVMMLKHVRAEHRDLPEKIEVNQNRPTDELTPEFWEREYGLVVPKRSKKRKRKDESVPEEAVADFPCSKCNFMAVSASGLKSHMKIHESKVKQKCSYCTFNSFDSSDMRLHWEVNHPHLEFKVEEAIITSSIPDGSSRGTKKSKLGSDEAKATVYYCFYCDMSSQSLGAIRSHWRNIHKEDSKSSMFKYREHSETKVRCAYCAEAGTKNILVNHIFNVHGTDKQILLVERDEDGWMCKWCQEDFFTTKEEIDYHHRMFHSHLQMKLKVVRRVFKCKDCTFDTLSLESMQKHVKVHLPVYRCKYCTEKFKTFAAVKNHFRIAHPDRETETRTITGDDLNREIDRLIGETAVFSDVQLTPIRVVSPVKSPPTKSSPTSPRVAKKSTTKQIVPMRPFPEKVKAVARKSTTQLPRKPFGTQMRRYEDGGDTEDEDEKPKYVSHYGRSASPVDLASLSITMAVAGLKMKVDCSKLAELFNMNINPTVQVVDFMKEQSKTKH